MRLISSPEFGFCCAGFAFVCPQSDHLPGCSMLAHRRRYFFSLQGVDAESGVIEGTACRSIAAGESLGQEVPGCAAEIWPDCSVASAWHVAGLSSFE